jgi:uncharacterized protein (UPF0335 family)
MTGTVNKASAQALESLVRRWLGYLDEIAEQQELLKQLKAEAKSQGFDAGALARIVAEVRKDPNKVRAAVTITETYITALGTLTGTPLGDWARQRAAYRASALDSAMSAAERALGEAMIKAGVTSVRGKRSRAEAVTSPDAPGLAGTQIEAADGTWIALGPQQEGEPDAEFADRMRRAAEAADLRREAAE